MQSFQGYLGKDITNASILDPFLLYEQLNGLETALMLFVFLRCFSSSRFG